MIINIKASILMATPLSSPLHEKMAGRERLGQRAVGRESERNRCECGYLCSCHVHLPIQRGVESKVELNLIRYFVYNTLYSVLGTKYLVQFTERPLPKSLLLQLRSHLIQTVQID